MTRPSTFLEAGSGEVMTVENYNLAENTTTLFLWQYGLWSFQTGGTNLERFLPKNQHTQRKSLNFEN